jgi:hypothetical protein
MVENCPTWQDMARCPWEPNFVLATGTWKNDDFKPRTSSIYLFLAHGHL